MGFQERIVSDPEICHGKACIKGTRIMVSVVLDNLAAGASAGELAESYPGLPDTAVRAALAYAADLASERVVAFPA